MKRWIRMKDGKSKQVEARQCSVPGLFLNKDPHLPDVGWGITHRASGLRLGSFYFNRYKEADRIAVILTEENDIDWSIKDPYELTQRYHGISRWMEKIVEEELEPDEYSLHK